jgi:hypothetical protein
LLRGIQYRFAGERLLSRQRVHYNISIKTACELAGMYLED